MTYKKLALTVAIVGSGFFAPVAQAAFVQWNIDPVPSTVTLAIPNQSVTFSSPSGSPGSVNAEVRNQIGLSSSWNMGNSARVDGLIDTNYTESGSHTIEFLSNPIGQMFGLSFGNYRPNPARYATAVTDSANPQGTFTGSTATDFQAVFGGKIRTNIIAFLDLAYWNLSNVSYDFISPLMSVSGSTGGGFSLGLSGANFGFRNADIAVDGLTNALTGQIFTDTLSTIGPSLGVIGVLSSTGNITDLGGQSRRLNLSMQSPITIDFGSATLNATLTASIVAYATVPEPTTLAMGSLAVAPALGLVARMRRRGRRRAALLVR